jgi:hypothetical protein
MQSTASRSEIDSADYFREEFSIEIGEENSNCVRFTSDEASRTAMGDITKTGCDVADFSACLGTDGAVAVEDARYGGDGNTSLTRYVTDGDERFLPGGFSVAVARWSLRKALRAGPECKRLHWGTCNVNPGCRRN